VKGVKSRLTRSWRKMSAVRGSRMSGHGRNMHLAVSNSLFSRRLSREGDRSGIT
jgi:hypothetical protein